MTTGCFLRKWTTNPTSNSQDGIGLIYPGCREWRVSFVVLQEKNAPTSVSEVVLQAELDLTHRYCN
jgi:hypothetical protein